MEELIEYLNGVAAAEGWPLSPACIEYLKKVIKHKSLKRGEYLLTPREICENMYFIEKGLLKCFYNLGKKSIIDWFFAEGQTVVSIPSFYDQVLASDFIEALEDCELFYITHAELDHLYRTYIEFNVIRGVLTNRYLRVWHRQARNLRLPKTDDRYRNVVETQPELVDRVTDKDLASYLKMDKATLSRVRSRFSKKK